MNVDQSVQLRPYDVMAFTWVSDQDTSGKLLLQKQLHESACLPACKYPFDL